MNYQQKKYFSLSATLFVALLSFYSISWRTYQNETTLQLRKGSRIFLVGNNLGSRMLHYDHFETEMQLRYADSLLLFRNMCDGGNTPGFRPNAGRKSPWAFAGAEKFQTELAHPSESEGHFETEDQWLTRLKADIIIAFFGYGESFAGGEGLPNFKAELDAFVKHTLRQKYNKRTPPQLALISPIAFEDLSQLHPLPDGKKENAHLQLYAEAMQEVAAKNKVLFVNAFQASKEWYAGSDEPLTIDGFQLNDKGYQKLGVLLADALFGKKDVRAEVHRHSVKAAVQEKNWMWHNDFKIPNAVHAYGQRYQPFGPDNYPAEIVKIRKMTAVRDSAIWLAAKGRTMDVAAADAKTGQLPEVKTNYEAGFKNGSLQYVSGADAVSRFTTAPGYKIDLFASEREFPDLAKPVQLSFDAKGRLWVAAMPSYPHYKPGDPKPNDKLLILEDTDGDGKADKQTVFAEGLHVPVGFELAPEGVYVSQGTNLVLLQDTNGDDKADQTEIVLSGFDDHDTHHTISAFCADPSGAIYMGEGLFLHSNVETAYGTVRGTWGGFFRYNPVRRHLERSAQVSIPNPWGIAFDEWGADFYTETSNPEVHWMTPSTVKPLYGVFSPKSFDLIEEEGQRVRPTSGLEFVYSRHFPNEVQGDMLFNNTIGFLGTKQHRITDDGTGFKVQHRQDLIVSDDKNFRPVDLEFAPDGSLYIADWHNILIGHMQHNARDPLRDHVHGRIYRVTYPSRPLVTPAKIDGAPINELLDNLKLPEYRTRYRTRRELRGRNAAEVLSQMKTWMAKLDKEDPGYEHYLLEALWVSWGLNAIDQDLLRQLLNAKDYRARAAAVRAVRYNAHQLSDAPELLAKAAGDAHGRVRLEAIVAASWLPEEVGMRILNEAAKHPLDRWMADSFKAAVAHLQGKSWEAGKVPKVAELKSKEAALLAKGKAVYSKEGYCVTCHQANGKGLPAAGFPPLAGTQWVTGNEERLIKIVLNGLHGPIEVAGQKYSGQVPMTPFGALLSDEEVAAVLTYVRNAFGNKAPAVSPQKVKSIRAATAGKKGFYTPAELLKQYPMEVKGK